MKNLSSTELAQLLLDEFIDNAALNAQPGLIIKAEREPHYQAKMRLYRLALVLMALMSEERNSTKFSKVRESLEALVLPNTQGEGMLLLDEIRSVMRHLSELLFPEGNPREMSWSMTWLQNINIQESNPVTLSLFAMRWIEFYGMIAESLGEFNLV